MTVYFESYCRQDVHRYCSFIQVCAQCGECHNGGGGFFWSFEVGTPSEFGQPNDKSFRSVLKYGKYVGESLPLHLGVKVKANKRIRKPESGFATNGTVRTSGYGFLQPCPVPCRKILQWWNAELKLKMPA